MNKILITDTIDQIATETLSQNFKVIISPLNMIQRPEDFVGIIAMLSDKLDRAVLESFQNLKVISNYAVGFNNIDIQYCKENKIAVGNTPDVLTDATSDLAITLLFMALRNTKLATKNIKDNEWSKWEPKGFLGHELKNKTVGIFGMGRIGEDFAKKLHYGWNCKILYHNRNPKKLDFNAQYVDFETLLSESGILSLHSPSTHENYQKFNLNALSKMKASSILINTARGQLINEKDLYEILKENKIFAAAVDVTDPEPIKSDNPLLKLNNFHCLPHIGSATFDARRAMAIRCAENIISGIETGKCDYNVLN